MTDESQEKMIAMIKGLGESLDDAVKLIEKYKASFGGINVLIVKELIPL